jgi:hypothetical protein
MRDTQKTERLSLRATPAQRTRWQALADAVDRKLGDWIRLALEDAAAEQEYRARIDDRLSPSRRSASKESCNG